jgi:hypothetical protein
LILFTLDNDMSENVCMEMFITYFCMLSKFYVIHIKHKIHTVRKQIFYLPVRNPKVLSNSRENLGGFYLQKNWQCDIEDLFKLQTI